jgi:lysophospholipase L1-like esterase
MTPTTKLLAVATLILVVTVALAALYAQTSLNVLPSLKRVACVGDSITEISGYPSDLQMLIGANYTVSNFGVTGSTISLNSDNPYTNSEAFRSARQFRPAVVIIILGTNDARSDNYPYADNFQSDYKQLISQFQSLESKPQIYLALPPPIFNNTLGLSDTNYTSGILPKIQQVANETGLALIDVYTPMLGHPEYFDDGVHPNKVGTQVIANTIYQQIASQV